jgi:hypothetical protein
MKLTPLPGAAHQRAHVPGIGAPANPRVKLAKQQQQAAIMGRL